MAYCTDDEFNSSDEQCTDTEDEVTITEQGWLCHSSNVQSCGRTQG